MIVLATNQGGGVMEWKNPRLWAIERYSVRNKREYAKRWGYHLELVDMTTKKRYAHEWRESWEKVDLLRNTMRKYPHAEWCVFKLKHVKLRLDYGQRLIFMLGSGGWTLIHSSWSQLTLCKSTSSTTYKLIRTETSTITTR